MLALTNDETKKAREEVKDRELKADQLLKYMDEEARRVMDAMNKAKAEAMQRLALEAKLEAVEKARGEQERMITNLADQIRTLEALRQAEVATVEAETQQKILSLYTELEIAKGTRDKLEMDQMNRERQARSLPARS